MPGYAPLNSQFKHTPRLRRTPLKRGRLPHIIVEYIVYSTLSRVARPLFRGVARRAGVCQN